MKLRDTKFGMLKHLACAALLVLACHIAVYADPFSSTILISLAISAALTGASIGLQLLFQPKPKPVDKNKLQGDIQITNVGEDIPITEVYGSSLGDGFGGMRIGGIIFYASPIRKVVVNVPSGSSGGGKGAPKPPPTKEYHYYIDLAVMVANRGPYRIKQIKANTDLLYQSFTPNQQLIGVTYEAEDRTDDAGGVTEAADVDCSGGLKANLDLNEWIEWDIIVADTVDVREMYIAYKSGTDHDIEVTVNGVVQDAVLPDSFNIIANVNLPQAFAVGSSNTVRIKNLTNAVLSIDRLVVGLSPIFDPGDTGDDDLGCYLSGVRYPDWINPEPTYNPYDLRDPLLRDDRGCRHYNYQANPNALGEISANIVSNGAIRIYPGNKTQLPDPLLQEHFEAYYGAGATPAFRNRCYVVFDNFEITKYSSVPNFTFVVEHESINSLGELYTSLADRAGLTEDEYDFSDLNAVPLRGYAVTERRAPSKTMELLDRVFDTDVFQDYDGKIIGIVPDETVEVTVPTEELDTEERTDPTTGDKKPHTPVQTVHRDESELPGFLDVSFFDPSKDFEVRNVHSLREIGDSSIRKANIETGLVLTEAEAQKFADRDLHKQYVEKDGLSISTFHKYTYLQPTQKIKITDTDGSTPALRVKAIDGWIPGRLEIKGVSRDAVEFPPRLFTVANDTPVLGSVNPPAPIIGTFIDLAIFREETGPGFYVAAALTDPHYRWAGAGVFREIEGNEWQALDGIPDQAVMGRTVSGADGILGDPPADPFPSIPDPPLVSWSPTGGSIGIAKSRKIRITYYDGVDESLPSGPTNVVTEGTTSTITVTSPPAVTGATHYRVYVQNGGGLYELQNGSGTAIGVDLTMTSLTTGTAQPPSIWDDTNEVTVDLYYGELESLTDDQVLEGRNFLVIKDEVIQFGTATRDNDYPNRWVLSHLQRGVKDTGEASTGHGDEERVVLFNNAWRWIDQDPSLANVTRTYKFVGAGDDLEKAWSTDWNWSGRTQYNTAVYAGVDNAVPVLNPNPPILATELGGLRVFILRPIQHGYSARRAEVRVRADDDDALITQRDIGNQTNYLLESPTEDANVDYRWQNEYRIDGSDGWSNWSAAEFYDFGTPPPPPPPDPPGGDPTDPGDVDPPFCFVDDVMVLMADWTEKPIQKVRARDFVMAWTHDARILPGRVSEKYRKEVQECRDLILSDDRIGVTEEHPFLPDFNKKIAVKEMAQGQTLRAYEKGWSFVEVESANAVPGAVWVNNLNVEIHHSFFVRVRGKWKAVYNAQSKYQY